MVAILTSGTLTDPDMLRAQPEAAYVLSLHEQALPPVTAGAPAEVLLSACYCDCASNTLILGQWWVSPDIQCPHTVPCLCRPHSACRVVLRAHLAEMQLCKLVPRSTPLGKATRWCLRTALCTCYHAEYRPPACCAGGTT